MPTKHDRMIREFLERNKDKNLKVEVPVLLPNNRIGFIDVLIETPKEMDDYEILFKKNSKKG